MKTEYYMISHHKRNIDGKVQLQQMGGFLYDSIEKAKKAKKKNENIFKVFIEGDHEFEIKSNGLKWLKVFKELHNT